MRTLWASLTHSLLRRLGRRRRQAPREDVTDYLNTLGFPVVGSDGEVLGADTESSPSGKSDDRRAGGG
jgi:hypothetical protein